MTDNEAELQPGGLAPNEPLTQPSQPQSKYIPTMPPNQTVEFNVWEFSNHGKGIQLITPTELNESLWEKLNAYVQIIKPDSESKTGGEP